MARFNQLGRRLTCCFIVLQAKGHLLGLRHRSSTHLWSRSNTHLHTAAQRGFHSNLSWNEHVYWIKNKEFIFYLQSNKQSFCWWATEILIKPLWLAHVITRCYLLAAQRGAGAISSASTEEWRWGGGVRLKGDEVRRCRALWLPLRPPGAARRGRLAITLQQNNRSDVNTVSWSISFQYLILSKSFHISSIN